VVTDSYTLAATALPARMHLTAGDANLTGFVDVNDVQRTLNYILNTSNSTTFSFWAANTYTAEESTLTINIQDIVSTVNIVLENQGTSAARRSQFPSASEVPSASEASAVPEASSALSVSGRELLLDASEPIAALCVELRGVRPDEVKLLLDRHDWQMQSRATDGGTCLLIFSPTGASLPVCSQQPLLRFAAQAEAVSATASSPEAEPVAVAIGDIATGISDIFANGDDDLPMYDLQGRRIDNAHKQRKGIYIRNNKKQVR